jgi:hypothetical protein
MKVNNKFSRILGAGLSVAMLASTLVTAVPAYADVTSAIVSVSPTTISIGGNYTLTFDVNNSLGTNATITVVFPSDSATSNVSLGGNVTLQSTAGFGQANLEGPVIATVGSNLRTVTINTSGTNGIGEAATVRLHFNNGAITNPSAPGNYTMTVATSNDTAAITTAAYIITAPFIGPLPGIITGKNAAGQILYQSITGDLSGVIGTVGVKTIELGAGTFNTTVNANVANQTIIATTPGTVFLNPGDASPAMTISADNVVVSGLTINASAYGTAKGIVVTGNNSIIRNVTFNKGTTQLDVTNAAAGLTTVENSIFNVTGNVTKGLGATNGVKTTNCTFLVDASGTGITSSGDLTLTNSALTGSSTSPIGASITAGTATVTGTTFTSLRQALIVAGTSNTTVSNSTVTSSVGNVTADTDKGAITANGGTLILVNNTISNSVNYALQVGGGNIIARFNNITGNTLNVRQATGTANASLNYWGSASGPSAASLNATDSNLLITTPFLTGATSNGVVAFNSANLTVPTTTGVDVTSANATSGGTLPMGLVAAAKYAANPQSVAPTGTPIAYYDVAIQDPTAGATVTIKFFGNVTVNTKVYYGGGLTGAWAEASSQGVNVPGGFAFVTITATSAPGLNDLDTPFVLTNIVPPPAAPTLVGPTGTNVAINTGFSWNAVAGADTYNFQVSTVSNFATTVASQSGLTATVSGGVALASNTTYFWRVQAVNAGGVSAWATSTFTTNVPASSVTGPTSFNITTPPPVVNIAPAQVTVTPPNITVNPPQVTVTAPPPAQVTVNPPQVTVQAPPAPAVTVNNTPAAPVIPTYILWTIILIGAVLIIALIVLIVRTRRVA